MLVGTVLRMKQKEGYIIVAKYGKVIQSIYDNVSSVVFKFSRRIYKMKNLFLITTSKPVFHAMSVR